MTFSCSAVSGNRSWKASIAVATCDLPMKPWGHCVHVTKSASTRRRCGRASKPDAAVAEGGSRLSTAAVVVVVVMVAMINRAEEQRNMKLGQAKHRQRPRFNKKGGCRPIPHPHTAERPTRAVRFEDSISFDFSFADR